jgi:hypothetical protein
MAIEDAKPSLKWREPMENIRNAVQLLVYPLILAYVGYRFNSHLDNTRKTEVMEKFIPRLIATSPDEAFLADRVIDPLLDRTTASEIHKVMRETWKGRLHQAVQDGNVDLARRIAQTANAYGGEIGQEVLKEAQAPNSQVLAIYQQSTQGSGDAPGKFDPAKNPAPSQVSKQVLAAATIAPELQQAALKSSASQNLQTLQFNWIYLGPISNHKWVSKNFVESLSPSQMKGQTITPNTEIFRRADLPRLINGEWKLGNIVGVLPAQQRVLVQDCKSVPGVNSTELWWAWVPVQ